MLAVQRRSVLVLRPQSRGWSCESILHSLVLRRGSDLEQRARGPTEPAKPMANHVAQERCVPSAAKLRGKAWSQ
jgi:hypothetical protein